MNLGIHAWAAIAYLTCMLIPVAQCNGPVTYMYTVITMILVKVRKVCDASDKFLSVYVT